MNTCPNCGHKLYVDEEAIDERRNKLFKQGLPKPDSSLVRLIKLIFTSPPKENSDD